MTRPRPSPASTGGPQGPRGAWRGAPTADAPAAGSGGADGPGSSREPVDWHLAERVGHRLAGVVPLAESYHRRSLEADFTAATERSAELVAAFTGLEPRLDEVRGTVLDRRSWTSANLLSFRRLLAPLTERVGEHIPANSVGALGRRAAGVEVGALLGWFSRRVLGQYDLMGTDEAGSDEAGSGDAADGVGSVYYVGPNVLGLEKSHGFRPRDFRLWVALHEVTHLVQFSGVPWLRGHFLTLVDETLRAVEPDPRRIAQAARYVIDELRAGRNPLEAGGLVHVLASPEQREVMGRVQALMALLEGHGNFVMDRLGEEHLEGATHMSRVLRERRSARGLGGGVQKALGIELKLRQYAIGERFLADVERRAGRGALSALWEAPEQLPSLDELRDAQRWLDRVHRPVV